MIQNTQLQTIPMLFVANKQDKENSMTLSQIQEIFKLTRDVVGKREFFSINCSAINGYGICFSQQYSLPTNLLAGRKQVRLFKLLVC